MGSLDNHTGPILHSRYSPTHINQNKFTFWGFWCPTCQIQGYQSVSKGRPRHNGDACTILKAINNHFIYGPQC